MAKNDELDLSAIIKKAEDAVQDVKDNQLKTIAFDRILYFLLQKSENQVEIKAKKRGKSKSTKKTPKTAKSEGPLLWLRELINEKYFSKPKSMKNILEELNSHSHVLKPNDLTSPLKTLCNNRELRRDKRILEGSNKKIFHWFNW